MHQHVQWLGLVLRTESQISLAKIVVTIHTICCILTAVTLVLTPHLAHSEYNCVTAGMARALCASLRSTDLSLLHCPVLSAAVSGRVAGAHSHSHLLPEVCSHGRHLVHSSDDEREAERSVREALCLDTPQL